MCYLVSVAKKRKDINELAKLILDQTVNEQEEKGEDKEKSESPKAKAGRKGGLKGGQARAKKLSPQRRREIAKKAVSSRWKKSSP